MIIQSANNTMNANVSINHHSSGIAGAKKGEKERKKKKENIFI